MRVHEKNVTDRLSAPLLLALHLLPGIILGAVFYFLAWHFIQRGLTGYLALLIVIPLCLVPLELGALLLWSVRFTGRSSLLGAIRYRKQGTVVDYVALPIVLFLGCGVISIVISPVSQYLGAQLSPWLPGWATQQALLNGIANCPQTQRSITLVLAVLLSGFVAPVVEELYFRGFLLARMEHLGWMAPVVNSLLFAVYHFYFPENVPGIFLAFLPISYIVWLKKDWKIGAIVHSLSNLTGVFFVFT